MSTGGWPADEHLIDEARDFLRACAARRTVVACDSDVDGLTSAVIIERALERARAQAVVLPVRRGEHVHSPSMRSRIVEAGAERLVVLDMGSRPAPIVPGLATLVIDHHHARGGTPPGALVVNGFDREPVATTSVLSFAVSGRRPEDAWLAALGAAADLGSAAPFASFLSMKGSGTAWTRAVALLNAARRAADPDPFVALDLIRQASSVHEITSGVHPQTAALEAKRREVQAETERCARVAPKVMGEAALVRFASAAQVHPIVATRWTRRLHGKIVIAANDGYLPGRTNFAVRSSSDIDLIAWLKGLRFTPSAGAEFANGHRRATGGSLTQEDFERFVEVLH